MYAKFRELLKAAEGRSEWVAAINADIRGFSSVMSGDPQQTALYLRAIYAEILDKFFAKRSFFKPTGDGLLIIVPFTPTDDELEDVTRSVIDDALRLHDSFSTILKGNKLVKFPHPTEIGIGISAGSVSRLISGKMTLDYTGRALNVATRLMDFARPSGVVMDSTLDFDALDEPHRKRFRTDHVYLKGVAERDGVEIHYTAPPSKILERYRRPIAAPVRFEERSESLTLSEAATRGPHWWLELTHEPADRSDLDVLVFYPEYRGGKRKPGVECWIAPTFRYDLHQGKPHLVLDYSRAAKEIRATGVPARAVVTTKVAYTVDPELLAGSDSSEP